MDGIILKYSGGGAILWGVPARDLSEADVEEAGKSAEELLASGLYESLTPVTARTTPAPTASPKGRGEKQSERKMSNGE